ncbi:hypothetical protein MMU07_15750 [Aquiflexum sp. LQ15W]|uniref:hypothetical protein n=1 Tax=Cognataquiflexum nitidum TaxID=2922272 RepID=UPI001F13964A|nr:hypothetical protein [Cognataquiflexum nitidum]MCH6201041.1 hypothetical protein [Cognataquiflexum nitidum]
MEQLTGISFRLESIKDKLKTEFIGLDEIIDQFIQAVNPWCCMADSQKSPLVVNLWGLTGVGKTSLVKRFLKLWDNDESVVSFNMGSKNNVRDMLNSMEYMYSLNGKPSVFIFDEFQHAKTMVDGTKEMETPIDRMIWQLMDNGKFSFSPGWHDIKSLRNLVVGLEICLERGVKVVGGKVVEGWTTYQNIMATDEPRHRSSSEMEERDFIPKSDIENLHEIVRLDFPYRPLFRDFLFQLDGQELVDYIKKVEKKACVTTELDFSKSLIFVLGNLDEAFGMSGIVSADQDPDLMYEDSKKITFSNVKEALKERFRMEEIARLGNIHIIYPSLNSQVYRRFIEHELQEIAARFENAYQCQLDFSSRVNEMLYEEGVTATQGFRPLRSSIHYIIESSLVDMLHSCYYEYGSRLYVDLESDDLILRSDGIITSKKRLHLPVKEAKRKKLNPRYTAITAVHEAGHALVYSILFGKFPKNLTITSSDHFSGGFVEGNTYYDFEDYEYLIRDAAVLLAGKKAEELVFGKGNNTTGCETDLKTATRRLVGASREGSVAGFDATFESITKGNGVLQEEDDRVKQWVSFQLQKATDLAEGLLEQNKVAFKAIVELFIEKKFLTAERLSEGLQQKGIDVKVLLHSYPAFMDYDAKLREFLEN